MERVRRFLTSFAQVTGDTPVKDIVVLENEVRAQGDREEMVERIDALERAPDLPDEAIHAPEGELVTEPRPVTFVVRVTSRAVPAHVAWDR